MAITLNDNIKVLAPKPTDTRSLDATNAVFASVADANAAIPYDQRHIRLTTNLVDGEYWYRDGKEDADLVPKISRKNYIHDFTSGANQQEFTIPSEFSLGAVFLNRTFLILSEYTFTDNILTILETLETGTIISTR